MSAYDLWKLSSPYEPRRSCRRECKPRVEPIRGDLIPVACVKASSAWMATHAFNDDAWRLQTNGTFAVGRARFYVAAIDGVPHAYEISRVVRRAEGGAA